MAAKDLDGDPLTYGISGPNSFFFTVTPSTGEVKLASPLDYEVKAVWKAREGAGRQGGPRSQCPGGGALAVLSPRVGLTLGPFSLPAADTLLVHSYHLRERRSQQPSESAWGAEGREVQGSASRGWGTLLTVPPVSNQQREPQLTKTKQMFIFIKMILVHFLLYNFTKILIFIINLF